MPFLIQGNTNWKFLLIVVVLAVIVGGGIWFLEGLETEEPVMPEEETTEEIEDETTDWQTYKDELYGYEIKYPPDLLQLNKFSCEIPISPEEVVADNQAVNFSHTFPFEYGDDKGDSHSTLTDISVWICVVEGNYKDLASYYYAGLENPIVLADQRGFKVEMGARGAGAEVYYLEKDINSTLVISFYYTRPVFQAGLEAEEDYIPYEEQKEIFNHILSTFRFINNEEIDECKDIQDPYQRKSCILGLALSSDDPSLCEEILENESQNECYGGFGVEIGKKGSCELCGKIENVIVRRYCMLQATAISDGYKFCEGLDINIEDFFEKYTDEKFGFSFYYLADNELEITENEISFFSPERITINKKQTEESNYLFSEYMPAGGAIVPWTSYTFYDDEERCVSYFRKYEEDWATARREIIEKEEDNPGGTEMPPAGHYIKGPDFYTVSGLFVFTQYIRWAHFNIVCLHPGKFLTINMEQTGGPTSFLDAFTKTVVRTGQDIEDKKIKKALIEQFLSSQIYFL